MQDLLIKYLDGWLDLNFAAQGEKYNNTTTVFLYPILGPSRLFQSIFGLEEDHCSLLIKKHKLGL